MKRLNVGCGSNPLEGFINLDGPWQPKADVRFDLETCGPLMPLPFKDDIFDELLMIHTIEHINNLLPLMQELWRVAKPDAILGIRCPHGASDDADEDPTHVRRMFPRSFATFSQPYYFKADYGYRGDWDCVMVKLLVRKARLDKLKPFGALEQALSTERNIVTEMVVELRAIKPARIPSREDLRWPKMHVEGV